MTERRSYLELDRSLADHIRKTFINYVKEFRNEDPVYNQHIQLKKEHTGRVRNEICALGETLGMNDRQLAFAETLAWLHDIGRFEQYHRYGTFADSESENHALLGIKVICSMNLLNGIDPAICDVIQHSIMNHNLPALPEGLSTKTEFYSRMLRDADKLDIWRVSLKYNIFHQIRQENFPPVYEVPDKLMKCFEDSRIIKLDQVDSFYDSILFRVSWIYDLSFSYSFKRLKERSIVRKLLDKLPFSSDLERIFSLTSEYITARIP